MSNVISLRNTGGFTRMDNDLYEALIGADLSGRELRVALAIHRLTAGFNRDSVKVAALYIAKMMYGEGEAEKERANVSRAINSLIRQRVLYREGGSRDPLTFLPVSEWKIETKYTVLKSTHCVEKAPSSVSKVTHIKDRKDNLVPSELVAAAAPTQVDVFELQGEQPELVGQQPVIEGELVESDEPAAGAGESAERIPYAKIQSIYNRVTKGVFTKCISLSDKRKRNIRRCWNMKLDGHYPFRRSEFWEGYFADCLMDPHWRGENDRNWKAHLEFLTREENVLRVLEGE